MLKLRSLVLITVLMLLVSCGKNETVQDISGEKNVIEMEDIRTIRSQNGDNISFNTMQDGVFNFEISNTKIQVIYVESGNIQGLYNMDIIPGIPKEDGKGGYTYSTPTKGSMKKYKTKSGTMLYFFGERNKTIYCVKEVGKSAKNKYGYNIAIANSKSDISSEFLKTLEMLLTAIPSYKCEKMKIGKFTVDLKQKPIIDAKGIYKGTSWVITNKGKVKGTKGFKMEDDGKFVLKYRDNVNIEDFVSW